MVGEKTNKNAIRSLLHYKDNALVREWAGEKSGQHQPTACGLVLSSGAASAHSLLPLGNDPFSGCGCCKKHGHFHGGMCQYRGRSDGAGIDKALQPYVGDGG